MFNFVSLYADNIDFHLDKSENNLNIQLRLLVNILISVHVDDLLIINKKEYKLNEYT